MSQILAIKNFFDKEEVKNKFKNLLGQRSSAFITSILHIVNQSEKLSKADPISLYQAASVAATLDLPLNENLGFAYIVPYNDKNKGLVAQFQMGYKGFIQLAQRSGQFKTIYSSPIFEGQIMESNPLDGYKFDFTQKKSDVVIGYAAKFTLINGFEAIYYMSIEQLKQHGIKYSKTFQKGYGLWKDNFEAMANKTVIKLLLSKFAPLSVDMQRAVLFDQSVVNDFETVDVTYVDNTPEPLPNTAQKEHERLHLMILHSENVEDLEKIKVHVPEEMMKEYNLRLKQLKKK